MCVCVCGGEGGGVNSSVREERQRTGRGGDADSKGTKQTFQRQRRQESERLLIWILSSGKCREIDSKQDTFERWKLGGGLSTGSFTVAEYYQGTQIGRNLQREGTMGMQLASSV
jgi:hypothetical protein